MGSTLIFLEQMSFLTTKGFEVEVRMDLYKIDGPHSVNFPEGYRFGWIAYDRYNRSNRILFDCHPPKGPHFHVGDDKVGISFQWESLPKAMDFFWQKVWEHFGEKEVGEEK